MTASTVTQRQLQQSLHPYISSLLYLDYIHKTWWHGRSTQSTVIVWLHSLTFLSELQVHHYDRHWCAVKQESNEASAQLDVNGPATEKRTC